MCYDSSIWNERQVNLVTKLFIKGSAKSYIGVMRKNNEDNYFLNGKYAEFDDTIQNACGFQPFVSDGVFGIFDGMGGQSKGEFASLCAAKTLKKYSQAILNHSHNAVNDYIADVNQQICQEMRRIRKQIGSTMAVLSVSNGTAFACNLGDSCIYHISGRYITKLSRDHTVAEQLYRRNLLSEEEIRTDIRRHRLTHYLGVPENNGQLFPHICSNIRIHHGDMFLLCTDGVSDTLDEADIIEILKTAQGKCHKAAEMIVSQAVKMGSTDNITAIVLKAVRKWDKNFIFSK